jgi:hypothetical protein
VNTTAARYQSLSINQTKLSGQCGRLKCCLNYELDTYMDALRHFPNNADHIQTANGKANLIKKDIFRNLMWYAYPNSSKHYPLTIERVKEIQDLNKQGIFPEEMQAVELETKTKTKIDVGFVNDVGQITLKNLEKKKSKNKKKGQGKGAQQQSAAPKAEGQKQQQGKQDGNAPKKNRQPNNNPGNTQQPKEAKSAGNNQQMPVTAKNNQQQRREPKVPNDNPQSQAAEKNNPHNPARQGQQGNRPNRPQQGRKPRPEGSSNKDGGNKSTPAPAS